MLHSLSKLLGLFVLVIAGSIGVYLYATHSSTEQRLHEVERKNEQLNQIVTRLSDEKRVAEVLVTDQKTIDGVLNTTLLFVEYGKDGASLPPRSFTIRGKMVHVSAQVIRFEQNFVREGDPLRGQSIALFTAIYGDRQNPVDAQRIDEPGKIPEVYRGVDPRASAFETQLWTDFWRLFDDENFRKEKGVHTSFGQDVWGPFEPGKLYTITLESSGVPTFTNA